MTKLKFSISEAAGIRDATPEEIIAWCLVRCIDEKDKLCVNGCDKCPIADIGYCAGIDEKECWRIIENKNIVLEVVK